METVVTKRDSVKNCLINCFLFAPTTFLTPISFILSRYLDVDKFMKLKQAIANTRIAADKNKYTYTMFPFAPISPLYSVSQ